MRDAYNARSGANNFPCRSRYQRSYRVGLLPARPRAARTNSRGEGLVNYAHSKSIVAAFVASAVMAAGFAAPALADIEAANRGGGSAAAPTKTPIKHVVIIFGENESFDHYFATYPNAKNTELPTFKAAADTPAVNGLSGGLLTHNPNLFNPKRLGREDAYTCSFNHDYTAEQKAADGGLLDKFVQATSRVSEG